MKLMIPIFIFIFVIVFMTPSELKDSLIDYGGVISPSYPGVGVLIIFGLFLFLLFNEEIIKLTKNLRLKESF